jgi:DNA-binding transcriptional MerR regulator
MRSDERLLRVGDLARRTGLTVRTLHHYDELGLLTPARRSSTPSGPGYRLYDGAAVERLTKILLLKGLGLSLEEIGQLLDGDGLPLGRALGLQIERLRGEIDRQSRLLRRLEALAARVETDAGASVDDLTETMEMMTLYEKHFTPEQLDTLERRREALGEEQILAVENEWPELIAKVRAAMERGADPRSPDVQALAARWNELVEMFTGGDPAMAESVRRVYRSEPAARQKTGLDAEIMEYVARARAAE